MSQNTSKQRPTIAHGAASAPDPSSNVRRCPTSVIPKRMHAEENAVIQMLTEVYGWRFFEFLKERDRTSYYNNFRDGSKGGTVRLVKLAVPMTGALARRFDELQKGKRRKAMRAARGETRKVAPSAKPPRAKAGRRRAR